MNMTWVWIGLAGAFWLGAMVGFLFATLLAVSGEASRDEERREAMLREGRSSWLD